jgi:hypothetical protein
MSCKFPDNISFSKNVESKGVRDVSRRWLLSTTWNEQTTKQANKKADMKPRTGRLLVANGIDGGVPKQSLA